MSNISLKSSWKSKLTYNHSATNDDQSRRAEKICINLKLSSTSLKQELVQLNFGKSCCTCEEEDPGQPIL